MTQCISANMMRIQTATKRKHLPPPSSVTCRPSNALPPGAPIMLKQPATKYTPFPPVGLADRQWPNRSHHQAADLDEHRPARRQPGAVRADERRAQDAHVQDALRHRLQGNRGRLPVGLADRFRLRAQAHRRAAHSRRRHHRGAHPGARAPDPPHHRVAQGRPPRHRARLQRHLEALPRHRLRHEHAPR